MRASNLPPPTLHTTYTPADFPQDHAAPCFVTTHHLHPLPSPLPPSPPTPPPPSRQVDRINELFAEAREEIENAKEDAETVYFNESAEAAKAAVEEVLGAWGGLLEGLGEEERAKMVRSMGLKMEQLKAELKGLEELHA